MTKVNMTEEQIDRAFVLFYRHSKSMGEIAKELGVSIYSLSPGLTQPLIRCILDFVENNEAMKQEREERVDELLEANNQYLERARKAEARVKEMEAWVKVLETQLKELETQLKKLGTKRDEEIAENYLQGVAVGREAEWDHLDPL